jgi:hypothetical protein
MKNATQADEMRAPFSALCWTTVPVLYLLYDDDDDRARLHRVRWRSLV